MATVYAYNYAATVSENARFAELADGARRNLWRLLKQQFAGLMPMPSAEFSDV